MAPVRRMLEATWIGEGSSVVAKMEGVEENGSSMGPSSPVAVPVVSSASHAHDDDEVGGGMAETEWRVVVGLWRRVKEGLWGVSASGRGRGRFGKRRWWKQ